MIIEAEDSAGNTAGITVSVKYDSTISDDVPPAIIWQSGPQNNERITTATGSIVHTITDDSGIDSVYYHVNGNFVANVVSPGNNQYQIDYTFSLYGTNIIILYAIDGSINNNKDSTLIALNYNTIPTTISNISPPDNSTNLDADSGVTVSWSEATDSDGDTITYILYYGTNTGSLASTTLSTTSFALPAVTGATTYYWYVDVCTRLDTLRSPATTDTYYRFTTVNKKAQISGFDDNICSINDTVDFSVTATDPEGISAFHWDFDYNTSRSTDS